MLKRDLLNRELKQRQRENEIIDNEGLKELLRIEQNLRNNQVKSTQELLRTAWDEQIVKKKIAEDMQYIPSPIDRAPWLYLSLT